MLGKETKLGTRLECMAGLSGRPGTSSEVDFLGRNSCAGKPLDHVALDAPRRFVRIHGGAFTMGKQIGQSVNSATRTSSWPYRSHAKLTRFVRSCEFWPRVSQIFSKAAAMSAVRFLKGRRPHLPSRRRARTSEVVVCSSMAMGAFEFS